MKLKSFIKEKKIIEIVVHLDDDTVVVDQMPKIIWNKVNDTLSERGMSKEPAAPVQINHLGCNYDMHSKTTNISVDAVLLLDRNMLLIWISFA